MGYNSPRFVVDNGTGIVYNSNNSRVGVESGEVKSYQIPEPKTGEASDRHVPAETMTDKQ
jgi:hypothetical protein